MNRGRRTDDGTYPDVDEERAKADERANASSVSGVTVSESSTTWEHGFVKVIMHTVTKGRAVTRTVKAIDTRPRGRGMSPQWDGPFEDFVKYVGSLERLFPLVTAKRHESETTNG